MPLVRRTILQSIPVVILAGVSLTVAYIVSGLGRQDHAPPPLPLAPPNAIRVERLHVEPRTLIVGQAALLYAGICNDSRETVTVQIYFGAENLDTPLLMPARVDLIQRVDDRTGQLVTIRDTAEERLRRTLTPGCHDNQPIQVDPVPPLLAAGRWRLILHVVTSAQDITVTSDPFDFRSEAVRNGVPSAAGHSPNSALDHLHHHGAIDAGCPLCSSAENVADLGLGE